MQLFDYEFELNPIRTLNKKVYKKIEKQENLYNKQDHQKSQKKSKKLEIIDN